jgi:malate/lactate dehydrogenase
MKITIIGAGGSVGSPAAFHLAAQKLADEFVLIDYAHNVAQQHAMDMGTAVSARDVLVRAGHYEDMAGSDIVIIAAGVPQGLIKDRMELLPKNAELMKQFADQINKHCPDSIIMTVTNPADPMNYAIYKAGGFDRKKVIGYTINDTFRFREFLAKAYDVTVKQVGGFVIGEHGSSQVLLFSSVMIDGKPVQVTEENKKTIYSEIPLILKRFEEFKAGRTAGWTCAIGFEKMVRAVAGNTGELMPCSVVMDGEYGQKGFSMSVPTYLGRDGIQGVKEFELAADEQEKFKVTTEVLSKAAKLVDDQLG